MKKKLNKKISFFTLGIIFGLFLIVFGLADKVLAMTNTWNFSNASDYNFDNTKIKVSSGQARLKTLSWYDPTWTKRKGITINGISGGTLTSYQLKITVPYDPDMQTDFKDIVFTSFDGTSPLDFWLETKTDGQVANFYVNVPSIPTYPDTTIIYMYYGNADASIIYNDGIGTFPLFEDFESTSLFGALKGASTYQNIPTYVPSSVDTTNQNVHPDIVYFANSWHGYKYWMVMTPYPNGNDAYENPSLVASNDGSSWIIPAGLTNPLVQRPSCDHNDDPELIYNSVTDELWVYYLETRRAGICTDNTKPFYNHNYLKLIKSGDGINWTSPVTAIDWNLNTSPLFFSPAVVLKDGVYRLWMSTAIYPDSSSELHLWQSNDGINWGTPQLTNSNIPIWHLNVNYIPEKSEYWMISSDYSRNGKFQFSKSVNGINWTTFTTPILYPSYIWNDGLYRATFLYDAINDLLKIWYSARSDQIWHTGYTEDNYTDFYNFYNSYNGLSSGVSWTKLQGSVTPINSTEQAKKGNRSGKFVTDDINAVGIEAPLPLSNNFFQEWDMYDDLDNTAYKMVNIKNNSNNSLGIGVNTAQSVNYYTYGNGSSFYTTSIPRTLGWHKFGISFTSNASAIFYIDDQEVGSLNSLPFNTMTKISINGNTSEPTTFYIDDVRVRNYTPIEPTYLIEEAEEALVENPDLPPDSPIYDTSDPSINPISSQTFTSLSSFTENAIKNGGEIKYQISNDGGINWYWYNYRWTITIGGYEETNTAEEINSNIGSFPKGDGKFLFKAYFHSDGYQLIKLDSVDLTTTTPPEIPIAIPLAGTYSETQSVTLSAAGSTSIRYSVEGIPASCSSGTLYSTPISVSISETIYARACDNAGNFSTSSFVYVISLPIPEPEVIYHSGGHPILSVIVPIVPTTPTNSNTLFLTRTLRLKMTGDDVKELQKYLNTHGYILTITGPGSPGNETNYFGGLTKKAVIKFQLANGLEGDGVVGPNTREKMNK